MGIVEIQISESMKKKSCTRPAKNIFIDASHSSTKKRGYFNEINTMPKLDDLEALVSLPGIVSKAKIFTKFPKRGLCENQRFSITSASWRRRGGQYKKITYEKTLYNFSFFQYNLENQNPIIT